MQRSLTRGLLSQPPPIRDASVRYALGAMLDKTRASCEELEARRVVGLASERFDATPAEIPIAPLPEGEA